MKNDSYHVDELREQGLRAVSGNAETEPAALKHAMISCSSMVVVAIPDASVVHAVASMAREANPDVEIVVRTHSDDESQRLNDEGFSSVFFGEAELAKSIAAHVLLRHGKERRTASDS